MPAPLQGQTQRILTLLRLAIDASVRVSPFRRACHRGVDPDRPVAALSAWHGPFPGWWALHIFEALPDNGRPRVTSTRCLVVLIRSGRRSATPRPTRWNGGITPHGGSTVMGGMTSPYAGSTFEVIDGAWDEGI